jgi:hypothetical protein
VETIERGARRDLMADCGDCFGLCCVALAFAKSADFALDKAAGDPCVNLDEGFRCTIHPHLRESGFKGCTVFDCFGAGQKVSQHTYDGKSWLAEPGNREEMFAVFPIMRQLHELLWYLDEALRMPAAAALQPELERATARVEAVTELPAQRILETDLEALRAPVADLLRLASGLVRAGLRGADLAGADLAGADLAGADLAGQNLHGAELRGALLIAADLRDADLSFADLIGADLRDANLAGADLAGALYVTQLQVNAARGDSRTKLPPSVTRPSHWER